MSTTRSIFVNTAVVALLNMLAGPLVYAEGPDMNQAREDLIAGKKARIIVPVFKDKTSSAGEYREVFGQGMSDMLITALFDTDRFSVLDREYSNVVRKEGGNLVKPDLFIVGAITGFDPHAEGSDIDLDQIPFGNSITSIFGKPKTSTKSAYIAMNLRIVDVETGLVVASTNMEGKASKHNSSVTIGGPMPGSISAYGGTAMEQAIRTMIDSAVKYVVTKTPSRYYRYEF